MSKNSPQNIKLEPKRSGSLQVPHTVCMKCIDIQCDPKVRHEVVFQWNFEPETKSLRLLRYALLCSQTNILKRNIYNNIGWNLNLVFTFILTQNQPCWNSAYLVTINTVSEQISSSRFTNAFEVSNTWKFEQMGIEKLETQKNFRVTFQTCVRTVHINIKFVILQKTSFHRLKNKKPPFIC